MTNGQGSETIMEHAPEDVGLSSGRLARINDWSRRLVEEGKLAGLGTMVSRRGQLVHFNTAGMADIKRGTPMAKDTIFRFYSMTKPLTSVAIMMLYEEGRFQLDDPITRFLPCFRNMRVFSGGMRGNMETVPANRDITFRDLLTHTSGLTYGWMELSPVDAAYRKLGVDFGTSRKTLGEVVELAASLPLIAQPGTAWNYSIATDVLGHLVAVISGQPFDHFLRHRVLAPLGMTDSDFHVPDAKLSRFAANYTIGPDRKLVVLDDPETSPYRDPTRLPGGGGGLVSTGGDYLRFCQMMLNKGELNGVRLLGRKTVELMTANHMRGDLAAMGQPRFGGATYEGIGFGLGFSVMLDPAKAQILGTPGEYSWSGAAATLFWIDPVEEMAVILLTQFMPASTWPLWRELRVLAYQSIID
jgi:CubicO group peptidase (beta-lactamase class C family)